MQKQIKTKNFSLSPITYDLEPCSRGFVALFAALLAALVLAMALGISNIAYKEIILSAQAKESHIAFFEADTAIECALYHDKAGIDAFTDPSSPKTLNCNGQSISVSADPNYTVTVQGTSYTVPLFLFHLGNVAPDPNPCAAVYVYKNYPVLENGNINLYTRIEALGYNNCKYDQTTVERALRATY